MKQTLACGTIVAMLSAITPVLAADMSAITPAPPPPVNPLTRIYDWTGLYVGINSGGVWGQSSQTEFGASSLGTGNFDVSGGIIGGTMGFNLQLDQAVFSLEGDLDWGRIDGATNCSFAGFTCTTSSNYLGTARGRFGYAWDRLMGYVTGGAAFGDVKQSFSPGIGINEGTTSNRVGWTIGGGVEYAFLQGWSAKVEYLHVDLGDFICGVACSGVAANATHTTLTEEVVRGGFNYRF